MHLEDFTKFFRAFEFDKSILFSKEEESKMK